MKYQNAQTLFVVCGLLLLGACGTPTIRAYSGAVLPQDQVAILVVDEKGVFAIQPVLDSLDGQTLHKDSELVNMRVEMTPGPHRASVRFFEQKVLWSMNCCSAEDKRVDFVAEAGHTYQVQANVRGEYPCFLGGTRLWDATIVEITPGQQPPQNRYLLSSENVRFGSKADGLK